MTLAWPAWGHVMPLHIPDGLRREWPRIGLDRALILAVVIVDLVLALNAVLGLQGPGPALQIVPDPAGQFLQF